MSFFFNNKDNENSNVTTGSGSSASTQGGRSTRTMSFGDFQQKPEQNYVQATIRTSSGKTYTLDKNTISWIQDRYKRDQEGTYGYDDADQAAMRAGQMSAATRKTYGKSNVDQQLAEFGLPSEKNLDKYLGQYAKWHTGGIADVFGDSVSPAAWTKMKELYKQDWTYDTTAEDQARKARGLMPSALEAKYDDTEIDDQLKASGLPSMKEASKYFGQYNNYVGIDSLYKNVARGWTNLRLQGIKNDGKEYPNEDGTVSKTGAEWYADAFFDELMRQDNGNDVYGEIKPLFKNRASTSSEVDPSKDYVTERGKLVTAGNKADALDSDYAKYNAFSYDDFDAHYQDYYDRYLKDAQLTNGQTVEKALSVLARQEDEQAEKEFYTVPGKKDVEDFVFRYNADYPDATPEKMFTDMYEHGLSDKLVNQAKKILQDQPGADKKAIADAFAAAKGSAHEKPAVEDAKTERLEMSSEEAVRYIEDYMSENGGWTPENATAAVKSLDDEGVPSDIIRSAVNDMYAQYGSSEYGSAMTAMREYDIANQNVSHAQQNANTAERVKAGTKSLELYIDNAIKEGADAETVQLATDAIERALGRYMDPDEGTFSDITPDDVINIINGISEQPWNNATAMRLALEDYGFGENGELTGPAADLTAGWDARDIRKVVNSIGSVRYNGIELSDETLERLNNSMNSEISDDEAYYSRGANGQLDYERFMHAIDWANEQIQTGAMNEFDAYNILNAEGFQDEIKAYMPDDWYKALFAHERVKEAYEAAGGDQLAWYEGLTDEEKYQHGLDIWSQLPDEEKAKMFQDYDWKYDPAVYRTGGQAWAQQFAAIVPEFATSLVSGAVKLADMVDANLTGREELWDVTKDLIGVENKLSSYGAVNDSLGNSAQLASIAADATKEIARMQLFGTIGGTIGHGTKLGQVLAETAGNEAAKQGVKAISKLGLTMMTSSPFVVNAAAENFAEAKLMGATTGEATAYGVCLGALEGGLEYANFDGLWGKVLGAGKFGKMIMEGGAAFRNMGVIGKARVVNMVASALGEASEETVSYLAETFWKTHSNWLGGSGWGMGTQWSLEDGVQQAFMGALTGFLGAGLSSGSITKESILYEYWKSNPETRSALLNTEVGRTIWEQASDTQKAAWRNGDTKVLSIDAFADLLTQMSILDNTPAKALDDYNRTIANINKKAENARAEAAAKFSKNSVERDGASATRAATAYANMTVEDALAAASRYEARVTYENTVNNARAQLQVLQRQFSEHYAALYLQNENNIATRNVNGITANVSRDIQNGATVTPESRAEASGPVGVLRDNEGTSDTAEPTVASIREAAYNRVYKDQEIGKNAAGEASGPDAKGMTRVEFADSERNNFQAKTTAKLRRVTLELAGLEAKEGMSAKEIFAEAKKAMTPEAAQKLDVYTRISKALGLDMVIRDVVTGTSGYVQDGKLYVTLNGKQNLLRVTAHELTHYMKDHVRGGYDNLRTHLISEVGGQGAFDQMVSEKAGEYGYDLNTEDGRVAADDEVCAELCEKMLENKDALARFVDKDMSAAQKFKARLGRTLVAIKSAIRSLGTSNTETRGDLIKEQDTIELWYKTLSDAIDSANAQGKAKATPATETAAEATATTGEAAPQAPPAPETNADLFIGEESARREQLRSELEKLAERGTRVNGMQYQEVNDILDRAIFGDRSNYNKADYAQIRGMLAQLIPEVQAMVNEDANVDLDTLNERVSTAIDYMLSRYHEGSEDLYNLRELIPNKIALSETAYNDLRAKDMTLRQASRDLSSALGKFVSFVYKKSPGYNAAATIDEVWRDIGYDPDGVGNIAEDANALIDYVKERSGQSAFDDLYRSQREDIVAAQVGEFLDAVQSAVDERNADKSEAARYTLDPVDPIEPTSNLWSRTATTTEAKEAFPDLWDVSSEESEENNPTQRKSTESTYRKIYDILQKEGFSGKILDASSGMGYGTRLGREEYGFDVEDIEPYPGKDYNPMYKDYSTLNEKYDAIISSAVLNVLPQDQRDALVVKMGQMLNPGGKMYITTRGTKGDVDNLAKTGKNIQLGPSEFVETVHGSYQKGFTNPELKAYLEDALGPGFTVEVSNKDNGGKFNNNTSIVVTKNGSDARYEPDDDWLEGFPSTGIHYNSMSSYNPYMQATIKDYMGAVDDRLVSFANEIANGNNPGKIELNRVTQELGNDIETLLGWNPAGYKVVIEPKTGEHIRNEHGLGNYHGNNSADYSMSDVNDFARLQYVIDNYDTVQFAGRAKGYTESVPGTTLLRTAETIAIGKRVDSMYYVVEAVPDTKAKTVYLTSAFMNDAVLQNKKGAVPLRDANFAPRSTAKTGIGTSPAPIIKDREAEYNRKNNIAQHSLDDDYMPLAERYDAGIATDAEIDEMQRDVEEAASAAGFPSVEYDPVIYDANGEIVPLSERFDPNFAGNRYSVDDDFDYLIKKYGAIPQGREPRARDVQVPRQTNDMNRVSQWIRSLVESDKLTDDQAQNVLQMVVEQDYGTYIPTSQAERMEEARAYIAERQPLQAQQEFHDMVMQGKFGVKTNALGIQLLSDASARGDIASVLDIAADLQLAATEAGQSAQIFNVLKELKGVGSAWYMQKVVDRMNSKYADRIAAGKMNRISVDPALMAELAKATTVDQMAAAEEAVAKDVARQLPLTWDDRLSSWRYFSMLANPTTHIRNITGNLLMKGLNTAKDAVATGIERTFVKDQSQRVHAILTTADRSTWGGYAQQSYEEQARNLSGGGKLGFETFIKQNMRSFDTKWVNALAKFNFNALEGEDVAFIRPAYKNALMQYMKAQGYTLNENGQAGKINAKGEFVEMTKAQQNAAIDWASQQAWKQTFRDASSLATMLNKLSKENAVSRLLVEGVMPFKKTPINIARRGLEYSPGGIIMGTVQLLNGVKKGKVTTAQAIDNLSSGITGTALMALGVFLAKAGIIRAGGEDKKKYETYLEDTGDQTYALKFGDYSINMSSIAPATIPLFMGVALQEMINQSGESVDLSTITDVLAGTLNPFMEMSFMASLNSALKNYNNDGIGGALGSTLMTAAQNYGSQYLPTLGGKVAQFVDPTLRSTKSSATSPIGGNMDYYVRSLAKKVPGLEATLQPDVDVWGRTTQKDSFGEWALDFANKFILPTNIKVTNRDSVDRELIRVVESTGVVDFLPSDGNKYFTVNGKRINMNAKQYAQYSQDRGQAAYAAIKDVMSSAAYRNASDEERANMLTKAKDAAYKQVNNLWKDKLGAFDR